MALNLKGQIDNIVSKLTPSSNERELDMLESNTPYQRRRKEDTHG